MMGLALVNVKVKGNAGKGGSPGREVKVLFREWLWSQGRTAVFVNVGSDIEDGLHSFSFDQEFFGNRVRQGRETEKGRRREERDKGKEKLKGND